MCVTVCPYATHNPVKTIKTSVMGTLNMLGLAKRIGARFLLTSTSEVYGDPLQHPQKEEYWAGAPTENTLKHFKQNLLRTVKTAVPLCLLK